MHQIFVNFTQILLYIHRWDLLLVTNIISCFSSVSNSKLSIFILFNVSYYSTCIQNVYNAFPTNRPAISITFLLKFRWKLQLFVVVVFCENLFHIFVFLLFCCFWIKLAFRVTYAFVFCEVYVGTLLNMLRVINMANFHLIRVHKLHKHKSAQIDSFEPRAV